MKTGVRWSDMRKKIKLRIKKKSQTDILVCLLIFMPFLFALLDEVLGLPRSTRYLLDVSWCLLLVYQLFARRRGPQDLVLWT
jgi:hypothetical protein